MPVTDCALIDHPHILRAVTCSLDRTVHIYDIHGNSSVLKYQLPQGLNRIALSIHTDFILCGSIHGMAYIINLSLLAQQSFNTGRVYSSNSTSIATHATNKNNTIFNTIEAHEKAINGILALPDNERFVTVSEDGSIKIWHLFTKQLLKELNPAQKAAIVSVTLIIGRPEVLSLSVTRPSICGLVPIKKYFSHRGGSGHESHQQPQETGNGTEMSLGSMLLGLHGAHPGHAQRKRIYRSVNGRHGHDDDTDARRPSSSVIRRKESEPARESDGDGKKSSGFDDEEDFVALPQITSLAENESDRDERRERDDEALQHALNEIETLKAENARWQQICHEMQGSVQQNDEGSRREDVASTKTHKKRKQ